MSPFKPSSTLLLGLIALLGLSGCSSHKSEGQWVKLYSEGQVKQLEKSTQKATLKASSLKNYRLHSSSAWYLLCSGLSTHAAGNFESAITYYDQSLQAIDFYRQDNTLENIQTLLLDERQSAYCGAAFEQLLARLYFSLALQQAGKYRDSAALLRQHEEVLQSIQNGFQRVDFLSHVQVQANPVAKYLLACHLEQNNDTSNAKILFKQSYDISQAPFIGDDLIQVGKRADKAWLIVVIHRGLLPSKVNSYSVGAIASAVALEKFMNTHPIDPAWSTLTGLAVPTYKNRPGDKGPQIDLQVNGKNLLPSSLFDVAQTARNELNQRLPVIAAKALTRQLLRQAAVLSSKKNETSHPAIGLGGDLFLLFANINTQADTRSWELLPYEIAAARIDLEPGEHEIELFSRVDEEPLYNRHIKQTVLLRPGINLVEVYAPRAMWIVASPQIAPQLVVPQLEINQEY